MVIITEDNKIVYKILFWGCSSSGKNTSLDTLSRLCTEQDINFTHKSDLVKIEIESQVFIDRGIFYSKRWSNSGFHCYTATPNNPDANLPKNLFNETDGVIFVADSQRSRLQDNIDSLKELKRRLQEEIKRRLKMVFPLHDIMRSIPVHFMLNKRDLDEIITLKDWESILRKEGFLLDQNRYYDEMNPLIFETVAIYDDRKNVYNSLKEIISSCNMNGIGLSKWVEKVRDYILGRNKFNVVAKIMDSLGEQLLFELEKIEYEDLRGDRSIKGYIEKEKCFSDVQSAILNDKLTYELIEEFKRKSGIFFKMDIISKKSTDNPRGEAEYRMFLNLFASGRILNQHGLKTHIEFLLRKKEQQKQYRMKIIKSVDFKIDKKSVCFTPIPINAALKATDDLLGEDLSWHPTNENQKEYLEKFFEKDSAEFDFVKRLSTYNKSELVQFLAKNGFPGVNIPDFEPPEEFGIAGVMDQKVEWKKEMKSTKIDGIDGNNYDAVDFDKHFIVFKSSFHPHPVVKLETKSEDSVFLTFLDTVIDDEVQMGFNMTDIAIKIINEKTNQKLHYDKVFVPKIDFSGDIDVNWIVGMKTKFPWFIKWAIMMAKLRLNHLGARAQAAFAGIMTLGLPPPPKILKFDRPFMIWFTHQDQVTFVMFVGFDSWKDPGDNIFGSKVQDSKKPYTKNDISREFYQRDMPEKEKPEIISQKKFSFIAADVFLVVERFLYRGEERFIIKLNKINLENNKVEVTEFFNCVHGVLLEERSVIVNKNSRKLRQEFPEIIKNKIKSQITTDEILRLKSFPKISEYIQLIRDSDQISNSVDEDFFIFNKWVEGIVEMGMDVFSFQEEINKISPTRLQFIPNLLNAMMKIDISYISSFLEIVQKKYQSDKKNDCHSTISYLKPLLKPSLPNFLFNKRTDPRYIDNLVLMFNIMNDLTSLEEDDSQNWDIFWTLAITLQNNEMWKQAAEIWKYVVKIVPPENRYAYNFLAKCLEKLGNLEEAIATYQQSLRIDPNQFTIYYTLGYYFSKKSMWEEAIDIYSRQIAIGPQFPQPFCHLGNVLNKVGRTDEAIVAYKKAIEILPDLNEPYQSLGSLYSNLNMWEEAVEIYQNQVKIKPNNNWAHYNLGNSLGKLGKWKEARNAFKEAIEINPKFFQAYYGLGIIYDEEGKLEMALEAYQKATSLNPEFLDGYSNLGLIYVRLGRKMEAKEAFEKTLKIDPNDLIGIMNLANLLSEIGEIEKAIEMYKKCIELEPNNPRAYSNLGNILIQNKEIEKAVVAFEKTIEIDPKFKDAYYNLGVAFKIMGETEKAIESYKMAISQGSKNTSPFLNLGAALSSIGKTQEAINIYNKVLEFSPKNKKVLINLGNAYNDSRNFEMAKKVLNEALEIAPNDDKAHLNLGNAYKGTGKIEKAELEYEKAINCNPFSSEAYCDLGVILYERGRVEEAIEAFKKSLEINPISMTWNNLGWVYYEKELFLEGENCARKALQLNPKNGAAWDTLGHCLENLKQTEEAANCYLKSLKFAPNNESSKKALERINNN